MRHITWVLLALSLGAGGCASPERIAEGARRHEIAADQARMYGDYGRAAREQSAADKQWQKAHERAQWW